MRNKGAVEGAAESYSTHNGGPVEKLTDLPERDRDAVEGVSDTDTTCDEGAETLTEEADILISSGRCASSASSHSRPRTLPNLNHGRMRHASVVCKNKVFVIGGENATKSLESKPLGGGVFLVLLRKLL